ncbi:MAG: phospho-N-acetylmuramoyl-pentapeptide-transferase, partial [Lachnospiraceae bacterium]|nr:phospho-N-acetylmuramoyl-pentapeptide-transferase [Lachnospiraceae bacterium]
MINVLLPLLLSFFITVLLGPVIIPFLRKLKVGNTEREELESHQIKTGTPTMGGIMMLITVTVISLFYAKSYPRIIPVLILTLGFGLIGFLDDYLKVVKRNKDGLIAWQKLILQIILTAVFAFCVVNYTDVSLEMIIPFTGGKMVDPGILT